MLPYLLLGVPPRTAALRGSDTFAAHVPSAASSSLPTPAYPRGIRCDVPRRKWYLPAAAPTAPSSVLQTEAGTIANGNRVVRHPTLSRGARHAQAAVETGAVHRARFARGGAVAHSRGLLSTVAIAFECLPVYSHKVAMERATLGTAGIEAARTLCQHGHMQFTQGVSFATLRKLHVRVPQRY